MGRAGLPFADERKCTSINQSTRRSKNHTACVQAVTRASASMQIHGATLCRQHAWGGGPRACGAGAATRPPAVCRSLRTHCTRAVSPPCAPPCDATADQHVSRRDATLYMHITHLARRREQPCTFAARKGVLRRPSRSLGHVLDPQLAAACPRRVSCGAVSDVMRMLASHGNILEVLLLVTATARAASSAASWSSSRCSHSRCSASRSTSATAGNTVPACAPPAPSCSR